MGKKRRRVRRGSRRTKKPKKRATPLKPKKTLARKAKRVAKRPTAQKLRHKRPTKRQQQKRHTQKAKSASKRLESLKQRSRRKKQTSEQRRSRKSRVKKVTKKLQAQIRTEAERALRAQLREAKAQLALLQEQKLSAKQRRAAEAEAKKVREAARTREAEQKLLAKRFKKLFPRLREIAKKKGLSHKVDTRRRRTLSDRFEGQRRAVRLNVPLSESTLEEVLYQIEHLARQMGAYNRWMALIGYEAMGSLTYVSAFEVLDAPEEEGAPEFQVGLANTGYFNEAERMLLRARKILEGWLDDVGRSALVHIVYVEVRNYSKRRSS